MRRNGARRTLRRVGSTRKIVIAGAGVAAIEALLALRAQPVELDIEVVAPGDSFLYRPVTVAEAFDAGEARAFELHTILDEHDARRHVDTLVGVDPLQRTAFTRSGAALPYDDLIIALGARAVPAVPGALAFRGRPDVAALREILGDLAAGRISRLAFALPGESTWPLPLYEMALLATSRVSGSRDQRRIVFVTPEARPLELFGARASQAVADLLEARGVEVHTEALPVAFTDGALRLAGGSTVAADRVVALPLLRGPRLAGLPSDADGFIPVDAFGRVKGAPGVYAAGDAVAFPLKQGGLATQQADVIAETIAAAAGAPVTPRPFRPVIRGLLLTGGEPIYLRAGAQAGRIESSVASDAAIAAAVGSAGRHHESSSSTRPLWWPPAKIAGRYLAPYLATARPYPLARSPLADLGAPEDLARDEDATALALLLADYDARWGDYEMALGALDSAEAMAGSLPEGYAGKRDEWTRALRRQQQTVQLPG